MKKITAVLSFLLLSSSPLHAHGDTRDILEIYTYQSFIDGGIATEAKRLFELKCKTCEVEFRGFSDAQSIINRLKIEGDHSHADLILGLDNNLMVEAREARLVQDNKVDLSALDLPVDWQDEYFVPFDYGYFAFIYNSDKLKTPPNSLSELAKSDVSVIIEDPRTSSPGLGLLLWVNTAFPRVANSYWEELKDNVVTVTKGWSEAYGLFLEGEADMVLSYTTSPFYHQLKENDSRYKAAHFTDGHYLQIEVSAIARHADSVDLANDFLTFMLSEDFQKLIPESNWMYPVIDTEAIPEPFLETPKPMTLPLQNEKVILKDKKKWINAWLEAL